MLPLLTISQQCQTATYMDRGFMRAVLSLRDHLQLRHHAVSPPSCFYVVCYASTGALVQTLSLPSLHLSVYLSRMVFFVAVIGGHVI